MKILFRIAILFIFTILIQNNSSAQIIAVDHSIARQWNEVLLESIRNDFARPTVHARNLHHISSAMYDSWAIYQNGVDTYFLGNSVGGFDIPYDDTFDFAGLSSKIPKIEETLSYATYRILKHRFANSPGAGYLDTLYNETFAEMGYDASFTSSDYIDGNAAALGNYIAAHIIAFGLQDGSNEANEYANLYYTPKNDILAPEGQGNELITDPNRWQPLSLDVFIDQSGNVIPLSTPEFLGPEWGRVSPFALTEDDLDIYERDGSEYWVYKDPGAPPYLDTLSGGQMSEEYKWGFCLVPIWGSHLNPEDFTTVDISPGALGNLSTLPNTIEGYRNFYDQTNGGDPSLGHDVNPKTGMPYEPNIVKRGDYTRVLAEFWADGPDSETPPGHWFTILNKVNDNPQLARRYRGQGPIVNSLEWDVKAYFILGGAMHDSAITAWGLKGYYDYLRPISAIRYMADQGQSSDPNLPNYSINGITLIPGYIEMVTEDDPLRGFNDRNVGKVKLYSWLGPGVIADPETTYAGVGWILAENWWPYQRPSFVTPPFAGYVSGHSTFSRAAAEVLTMLTGDPFFPGGIGSFRAPANEFLVFEDGPTEDIELQWATYRDASDQTSLSRIWGGIHPPADDIPGRIIGEQIGIEAFDKAQLYFLGRLTSNEEITYEDHSDNIKILPNPIHITDDLVVEIQLDRAEEIRMEIYDVRGRLFKSKVINGIQGSQQLRVDIPGASQGEYIVHLIGQTWKGNQAFIIISQ